MQTETSNEYLKTRCQFNSTKFHI